MPLEAGRLHSLRPRRIPRGGLAASSIVAPGWAKRYVHGRTLEAHRAPPLNDVAAMGRVWYLEATACRRRKAEERLVESARKVCRAAKADGYWRERYHPHPDGSVSADGAQKYCEYAAVLVRTVHVNRELFWR